MTITLSGLLAADTPALRAVAAHWSRLVEDVDAAVLDLGAATQDLPHHWSGPDAQAAADRAGTLRTQIGNAHLKCAVIATAMRTFADDLEQCKRMLDNVVGEARGRGLTIDLRSGTVTAPLGAPAGAGEQQLSVDAYAAQISEIIQRADAADAKARAVLADNSIAEWADLPTKLHYRERMDDLDRMVFPTLTSDSQAQVWQYAHPVEKERVIAEQPEVYGSAPGVPPADRDRANRLLLAREKSALLDQQAHATKEQHLAVVNTRLAAIDRLEQRLAGPGALLVDYRPGDEANTTVTPARAAGTRSS